MSDRGRAKNETQGKRSVRPRDREVSDSGKEKCQTQGMRSVRSRDGEVSV